MKVALCHVTRIHITQIVRYLIVTFQHEGMQNVLNVLWSVKKVFITKPC